MVSSCLENLRDCKGASAMATKQRKILTELKQEQVIVQQEELQGEVPGAAGGSGVCFLKKVTGVTSHALFCFASYIQWGGGFCAKVSSL